MSGLNRLAAQLMQSQSSFQQASAQMALQELMRRLQQLARQQQALNERTREAQLPAPGEGGQPSAAPGGGELARQQGGIRTALQQLLGQMPGQSGLGQQLGGLPVEMDEVEEQLRGGQVTQRTTRQQADILHKMLDAQRSLYDQERESRQRIAEAPRPYRPASSPPLLRRSPPSPLPMKASSQPRELPLGYEELARQYLAAVEKLR